MAFEVSSGFLSDTGSFSLSSKSLSSSSLSIIIIIKWHHDWSYIEIKRFLSLVYSWIFPSGGERLCWVEKMSAIVRAQSSTKGKILFMIGFILIIAMCITIFPHPHSIKYMKNMKRNDENLLLSLKPCYYFVDSNNKPIPILQKNKTSLSFYHLEWNISTMLWKTSLLSLINKLPISMLKPKTQISNPWNAWLL